MTQFLPPNLLALFAARDPIPYLPPIDKLSWEKKTDGYSGISHCMTLFEDPSETPPPKKVETKDERLERKRREKAEQMQYKLEQEIALWDPHNAEQATTDPYKTLFVARVNYDTSESKLRREFEIYGPIKKIVIVHNKITGKPRGYAFIEYEHERDMHSAYKHADGKKIDNRRVLVDVERARTVKGWLPRRLGGGLGGTRKGGPDVNVKHSGREDDRRRRSEDRVPRERERTRERERERERRSRDRDRDRERERDRRRKARRSSPAAEVVVDGVGGGRDRKRRRSRSRDRGEDEERRRHRSKSRERRKRSRSPRERKHRRDRDRDRDRNRIENDPTLESMKIKQEPDDDYPDFPSAPMGGPPPPGAGGTYYNNYPLKEEDERPKNGTKYEDEDPNAEIDY